MKFDYIFINTHPIQYNAPFYRFLSPELNVCVYYLTNNQKRDPGFNRDINWDVDLFGGYKYEFFCSHLFGGNVNKGWGVFSVGLLIRLWREARGQKYIIPAWNPWIFLLSGLIIKMRGGQVILRIETPFNQYFSSDKRLKLYFRYIQIYIWKYISKKFLYIGTQNKLLWQHIGVDNSRLFFAGYCVDNNRFRQNISTGDMLNRNTVKKFLFVGKLSKKKRLDFLVQTFRSATEFEADISLSIVGDGELKNWLLDYIRDIPNIDYLGFKNQSELAEVYDVHDCIILPSGHGETWGLVVNEALNFGLAAITSDCVGSGYDLINDKNGKVFKLDDKRSLIEALHEVRGLRLSRMEIYEENLRILDRFSFGSYKETLISLMNLS